MDKILDYDENYFSGDTLKEFMKEVKKYPVLKKEETLKLFEKYQNGDQNAYEQLINCNLRLVVKEAHIFSKKLNHLQIMDLIQEGIISLMYAITIYNPEKASFSTIATMSIRQRMTRAIDDKESEIRRTSSFNIAKRKYDKLINSHINNGTKIPSDEEICDILDISNETLQNIKNDSKLNAVSLNDVLKDSEDTELGALLGTTDDNYDDLVEKHDTKRLMIVLKEILKPVEYYVIYYRYFSDNKKTLEDIANIFNITREAIRLIENRALKKIKPYMEENNNLYAKVFRKLDAKISIDRYKINPIQPQDIAKFMYLDRELTEEERRLLFLKIFGKYSYTLNELAEELFCSIEEIEQINESLKKKMFEKFKDKKKLKSFIAQALKNYGTKIYSVNLDSKEIDYEKIKELLNKSYEDIISIYSNEIKMLTPSETNLLTRYFQIPRQITNNKHSIEKDVYLALFGYKNMRIPLSNSKLYEAFLRRINEFDEEQILYLECFVFNKKRKSEYIKKYPDKTKYNRIDLEMKLLMIYYNIHGLWKNTFTKERYLEVKKKYKNKLTERRILLLDLFYGVDGLPMRIKDIAEFLDGDYIKIHDEIYTAREFVISLDTFGSMYIDIDCNVYKPYILDKRYTLTDETRYILKLFVIEGLTYEEIAKKTGLNKVRVSNIITDGIRKIDYYRFGLLKILSLSEEEYQEFISHTDISIIDSKILYDKVVLFLSNEEIMQKYNISLPKINHVMRRFEKNYMEYTTRDKEITKEDITIEINKHPSDSVISDEEKYLLSLFYGIKNSYNKDGVKYLKSEINKLTGKTFATISKNIKEAINNIKARKYNLQSPELIYINRVELEKILNNPHLPLSDDKKEIISYLLGINGYPYQSIDGLAKRLGVSKPSLIRAYERGILTIYKYLNGEIEDKINFELDIIPILKYFSKSEELLIKEHYKNNLTGLEIAEKYDFNLDYVHQTLQRLKIKIYEILNDKNVRRFDFAYYREVIDNPKIPFYGDKELAKIIFDLFFGESILGGMSVPKIKEYLNIPFNTSTINKFIFTLMVSIYKFREGITKDELLTYENILSYYERGKNEMNSHKRKLYENCLNNELNKLIYTRPFNQTTIIFDLLKEKYPNYFDLDKVDRKEVIKILRKIYYALDLKTAQTLMSLFEISEREFMNGKEKNHVFKILNRLESLKRQNEEEMKLRRICEN